MGGRAINDHSSMWGAKASDSVFPKGPNKVKTQSSAEGSGAIAKYEDTTETIKAQQMKSNEKIKAHPMKPLYRG